MEINFKKDELLNLIANWILKKRPKELQIDFIDCNGIEVNAIEKIVIREKK